MEALMTVLFAIFSITTRDKCLTEIEYLQEQFALRVGGVSVADNYKEIVTSEIKVALNSNKVIESAQYLLFVDRNPSVQLAILFFVDPSEKYLVIIGADKVSTGNPSRKGHFITPLGFWENSPRNMSYRALGTKNSKGWRGLGSKGSRVWDFGWVETHTRKGQPYQIRLLLHATDPDHGESRLGRVDSKGCIRISGKFNYFLDHFALLDAKYENDDRVKHILLSNREPVCYPGQFVLVGDSQ